VAINSGSDITINAADIILIKDNLIDLINAIQISKKSFNRIKFNFFWAILYNAMLIPIAMGALYPVNGFRLDPMLAGGAMAFSSISVVVSSLMLKLYSPYRSKNLSKVG
jgi:Cu+-exporting ATPase